MKLPRFLRRSKPCATKPGAATSSASSTSSTPATPPIGPAAAPQPWTPGRVIDLFRGWDPGQGVNVSISYGIQANSLIVLAGRPGPGGIEASRSDICVCGEHLAATDYEGLAAAIKAAIARQFAANPFEFKVSSPAPADVRSN